LVPIQATYKRPHYNGLKSKIWLKNHYKMGALLKTQGAFFWGKKPEESCDSIRGKMSV
jgi:hypothetical protein